MPDITPVVLILDGQPVSNTNPLPSTGGGGGGGGTVDQGKQGSIASPWFVQPTADGATVSLPLPAGAATAAKQDTGNSSLATIAAAQTDGSQKTQVTSSALPTGAATAVKQPALGTAGTPSADVLSVQGVVGGTAIPVSFAPSGTQDVNLTKVGGSAVALGQAANAASLPVTLSSTQTGTAGTPSAQVLSVQGVSGGTAVKVDGSAVTQPVSGTVTANIGTTNGLALDATVSKLTVAQGAALGTNTQALVGGSVTTGAPTYTTGTIQPFSLDASGNLRVTSAGTDSDAGAPGSAVPTNAAYIAGKDSGSLLQALAVGGDNSTNPSTGKLAILPARANAAAQTWTEGNAVPLSTDLSGRVRTVASANTSSVTGSITTQDVGSATATGQNRQSIVTGTPTVGSFVTSTLLGANTCRFQIAGTWTGTIQPELSTDGGTTWTPLGAHVTQTPLSTLSWTANGSGNFPVGGATNVRLRAVAAITGTANLTLVISQDLTAVYIANSAMRIIDSATGSTTQAVVKAASTAAATTDTSLVVALSPNSNTPRMPDYTGSGAVTNGQPTLTFTSINDIAGIAVDITTTWTGTITFQGSIDGSNFFNMYARPLGGGAPTQTTTANGQWWLTTLGLASIRFSGAGMTGSASVAVRGSQASGRVVGSQGAPNASGTAGAWYMRGAGTAGSADANPVTVQGIASMTPVQVSQATASALNATVVQGAGSGAAATFWYSRITDGTNTMPTMDTAARSGFHRITDGTNTAAVKAASTAAVAADPALVVTVSPNSPATVVGAAASGAAATGNPVLIAGLDTTNARTLRTNASGNLAIVGGGTSGASIGSQPVQIGGNDGTNLQTIAVDTAGRLITAPAKNAQLINTTTAATTLKSGAGVFRGFVIQNASSGGSGALYVYDNTAASGTAFVGMFTTQPLVVTGLNIPFSTGLTVQITTAACPILFMWD